VSPPPLRKLGAGLNPQRLFLHLRTALFQYTGFGWPRAFFPLFSARTPFFPFRATTCGGQRTCPFGPLGPSFPSLLLVAPFPFTNRLDGRPFFSSLFFSLLRLFVFFFDDYTSRLFSPPLLGLDECPFASLSFFFFLKTEFGPPPAPLFQSAGTTFLFCPLSVFDAVGLSPRKLPPLPSLLPFSYFSLRQDQRPPLSLCC